MELALLVELLAAELAIAFRLGLFKDRQHVLFKDRDELIAIDNVALFHPPISTMLQIPVDVPS